MWYLIESLIERQSDRGQLHDGLGSFACGSVVSTTFVCGHIIQQHYYSVVSSENHRQQVTIVLVTVYKLLYMLILTASLQRSSGDITGCSRGIYGDDLFSASAAGFPCGMAVPCCLLTVDDLAHMIHTRYLV